MAEIFKDFPCLYFTEKIDRKDQVYLFTMLGAMFGKNSNEVIGCSELFSHTCGILGGTALTEEEVSKNLSCFDKPYKDCRNFYRRKVYADLCLKDECCAACPYSHSYANDALSMEREVLQGFILHPDRINKFACSASAFTSKLPVSCNNKVMSTLPLIAFNAFLYNYIVGGGELNSEKIVDALPGVADGRIEREAALSFVKLQLRLLQNSSDLSNSEMFARITQLTNRLPYTPPQLVRPESAGASSVTKTKRNRKLTENIAQINQMEQLLQVANELQVEKTEPMTDPEPIPEKMAVPVIESELEKPCSSEKASDNALDVLELWENTVKEQGAECLSENSLPDQPMTEEMLGKIDDVNDFQDNDSDYTFDMDFDANAVELSFDIEPSASELEPTDIPSENTADFTLMSEEFCGMVYDCSGFDTQNIINFMQRLSSTESVCVEKVTCRNTDGLLFYLSGSYFFVAAGIPSTSILKKVFANNCVFYSGNPIPVYALLIQCDVRYNKIESVLVFHAMANESALLYPLNRIFNLPNRIDVLRAIMPQYAALYSELTLSEYYQKKYREAVRLEYALAHSADISMIALDTPGLVGGNALNYTLSSLDCDNICRSGSLILVTLSAESKITPEKEKRYWEDVAGRLAASSAECIGYSFLISLGTGIGYFSCYDQDNFFDCLMVSARSSFKKIFNSEVKLSVIKENYL